MHALSEISTSYLLRTALGIADSRRAGLAEPRKSVSMERTFRDESSAQVLLGKCEDMARRLSAQMQTGASRPPKATKRDTGKDTGAGTAQSDDYKDEGDGELDAWEDNEVDEEEGASRTPYAGKTLTIKLKLSTFEVRTRSVSFPRPTNDAEEMVLAAVKLLRAEMPVRLRLLGVKMHGLVFSRTGANNLSDMDAAASKVRFTIDAWAAGAGAGSKRPVSSPEVIDLLDDDNEEEEDGAEHASRLTSVEAHGSRERQAQSGLVEKAEEESDDDIEIVEDLVPHRKRARADDIRAFFE
jgi:hypothetical protein